MWRSGTTRTSRAIHPLPRCPARPRSGCSERRRGASSTSAAAAPPPPPPASSAAAGGEAVGLDASPAQLHLARERGCEVALGRAESLPFENESFAAAVSLWTHTDVDDWPRAVNEARRVVRPGGPFVYVGVHPCFVGPHSLFVEGRGVPQLHAGWYRQSGRY